jgi:hypothetical protein
VTRVLLRAATVVWALMLALGLVPVFTANNQVPPTDAGITRVSP